MWNKIACLSLAMIAVGCGDPAANMKSGETVEDWAELDAVDEALRGVGMSMDMGSAKSAQKELDATALKSALDGLKSSTAPSGYDSSKVDAVVTAGDALIAAAKGSADDFKAAYDKLMADLKALRKPVSS